MAILLSYLIFVSGINLKTMIEINGSVLGFLIGFAAPVFIHLKCTFYNKSSGFVKGDDARNAEIAMNVCQCDNYYSSKLTMYL